MKQKRVVLTVLSAALLLLTCVSCGRSEEMEALQDEYDSFLYLEVLDHLDRQGDIYADLEWKVKELAEDPDDIERQQWLNGYMYSLLRMTQNRKTLNIYDVYSGSSEEVHNGIGATLSGNCVYSVNKDIFLGMSREELESLSQIYGRLRRCYDRSDETSFACHVVERRFEGEDWQTALQELTGLLQELDLAIGCSG